MQRAEQILEFWFGKPVVGEPVPSERRRLWFGGEPETDRLIREKFAVDLDRAQRGEFRHWSRTPRGALALIIVFDQFPRNIHRGTPLAYACDGRALTLCLAGLDAAQDRSLAVAEKAFFYLPLEHAEDLEAQRRSVALFSALRDQAPPALAELCEGFFDYAVRHQRIIERFGRFPHRNAVLGRSSSPAEIAFLRQPGSSF